MKYTNFHDVSNVRRKKNLRVYFHKIPGEMFTTVTHIRG